MVNTGLAADLSVLYRDSINGTLIDGVPVYHHETLSIELAPLMETMVSAPDQIMLAIGSLRSFTRALDRMMAAANDLVETAEEVGYDRIKITNKIRAWDRQLGSIYGDFAKARSRMYTAAKAARIPTKRFSKSRPKKSMKGMGLPALATSADRIAQRMVGDIQKTGNQAAFLLRNLDKLEKKWVKRPPRQDSNAFHNDAGAVIGEFLILRDMVGGSIFAAMNGIVKRLDAMSKLGGVDKWGNPPRPVRVPTPAEVADRAARMGVRTREVTKMVRQEAPPKERPEPKPKPRAKPHPGYDERYPKGWTPGAESSRQMPTFMWKGGEYSLTPVLPQVFLAQMPEEMRDAHAAWATKAGQRKARAAWARMESVMGGHIPGADAVFEEIVALEHNRAAGQYALDNGQTMRPVYRSVKFLDNMGLNESQENIVYSKEYRGIGKFRIRRAMKKTSPMLRSGGKKKEIFVTEFQASSGKWEPQPQRSHSFRDAKLAISDLVSAVRHGDRSKVEERLDEATTVRGKGKEHGTPFQIPTPGEFDKYRSLHLGEHFSRIYGKKVASFAAKMHKKYERDFPGIKIKGDDRVRPIKSGISKKYGPEFGVSVHFPAKLGKQKDASRIGREIAKAIKSKLGGRVFRGDFRVITLGTDRLAPVDGWVYTLRYYPHADKMKDDPAFAESVDADVDDSHLMEAASQSLTKMLPWADDPEFGGANAI